MHDLPFSPAAYIPHPLMLMLALPFLGAVVLHFVDEKKRQEAAWTAALVTLLALLLLAAMATLALEAGPLRTSTAWLPSLGVSFALRLDGLSFMFALLILAISVPVYLVVRVLSSRHRGR